VDARGRRRGELHRLRDTDPAYLIAVYRRIAALDIDQALPGGVTFVTIVETILDHEMSMAAESNLYALRERQTLTCSRKTTSISKSKESEMFRLAIIDASGKIVAAKDLSAAADLLALAEQARTMIRDCERLAREAKTAIASPGGKNVPYLA
jgi:hypothetical protein